jgi:hypothetical protein
LHKHCTTFSTLLDLVLDVAFVVVTVAASLTMMNGGRNGRESLYGSINHNRRSNTFNHSNAVSNHNHHDDNSLDLFSNNRRSLSLPSSDDSSDGTSSPLFISHS